MSLFFFQVRDYIHVIDLADGHIAALRKLDDLKISKDSIQTLISFSSFYDLPLNPI